MPLTTLQMSVYKFIRRCIQVRNEAPTLAEIRKHFQIRSASTVSDILVVLEHERLLVRTPNISRGIALAANTASKLEIDGFEPEEEDDSADALVELARAEAGSRLPRRIDPETYSRRERYYKDWRERMRTWIALQNQWMPRRGFTEF